MRTQAAVLYAAGTDWKVEDIELDPPKTGEVLVRVAAAGLCHSEEHHRVGDVPFAAPMIGGHEGAGFVEETGPGVTLVKPGDGMVTRTCPLEEISQGYADMHDGKNIRGVLVV